MVWFVCFNRQVLSINSSNKSDWNKKERNKYPLPCRQRVIELHQLGVQHRFHCPHEPPHLSYLKLWCSSRLHMNHTRWHLPTAINYGNNQSRCRGNVQHHELMSCTSSTQSFCNSQNSTGFKNKQWATFMYLQWRDTIDSNFPPQACYFENVKSVLLSKGCAVAKVTRQV